MTSQYQFAFWNLENLFEVENAPLERRSGKLKRAIGDEVQGWTQVLPDRKVSQLTSSILRMNGGKGPDFLGVCEVENEYVMNLPRNSLIEDVSCFRRSNSSAVSPEFLWAASIEFYPVYRTALPGQGSFELPHTSQGRLGRPLS
jgi:hypothetical protein